MFDNFSLRSAECREAVQLLQGLAQVSHAPEQ
ncbi:MAG: hypothetical protein ACI9SE_002594 [Neolewinella sp.]|jgi:hypothetical protein